MTRELLHQIKENIKADGRTPSSWARVRNLSGPVVISLLAGYYNPDTATAKRVIEQLKQDGYYPPELDQAA